jgi:RNase P subunit RPR2
MPASSPMFCFTSNKIESHPCANCRAPMMHVRLAGSNQNQCTFECFNCNEVDRGPVHRTGSALPAE